MARAHERRLAAILAADVVGYSRLMEADEEGTLARLQGHRSELIDPTVAGYRGRTVKLTGDGALVEFPSVVDAARCAVAVQRGMVARNAGLPAHEQIVFRIGINVGDVINDDGDLYGDGVNIAARLEAMAPPGGICLSGDAFRQVEGKVEVGFEDLGEHQVKNIERPLRVYQVLLDSATGVVAGGRPQRRLSGLRWSTAAASVAVVVVMAWWQPWVSGGRSISMQGNDISLPVKPSIAVLPFANLGAEDGQAYFAQGMADDIITDLSKISGLFVIARNSSFQFEPQDVDVTQVADDLGVRFVLEGSVRRAGDLIRINAQLVDALTGGYVWADRFDGRASEVFEMQNKVTQRVVNSLAVALTESEQDLQRRSETANPEAHDAFLRGWAHYKRNTARDYARAVPYFEEAIGHDPQYRRAFAALAAVYWNAFANGRLSRGGEWVRSLNQSLTGTLALAAENLEQAKAGDVGPVAYQVSSGMLVFQGRYQQAIAEAERAIELSRNDPAGYEALGRALIFAGQPLPSIDVLPTAMRLDPGNAHHYQHWLGLAQYGLERYEDAARSLAEASQRNPDDERILIPLAATYGMMGREEEGRRAVARLNDLRELENERLAQSGLTPGIDLFLLGPLALQDMDLWPFKEQSDRERLREGLRRVGVPASGPEGEESPKEIPGAVTIDVAKAKALFDRGVKFVDVRGPSWSLGHVPGATHLFLKDDFNEAALATVAGKDEEVVFYCMGPSCLLSSEACARAVSWGYERAHYFRDGFPAWQAAGYAVETPGQELGVSQ